MSSLRRFLGRGANRALKQAGLSLAPIAYDFDARLESGKHRDRMFREITSVVESWRSSQTAWKISSDFDVRSEIESFFQDYLQSPYRDPRGGSRFGNLLWLNLLARFAQPDTIIDSGTYTGASAWALSRGAPKARLTSCDIDLSQLVLRVPSCTYVEKDWTTLSSDHFAGLCIAYFDDHLDQGRRLREAHERKLPFAIFDDDFSVLDFVGMAHRGAALPKISFIIDPELADGEVIEWSVQGQRYSWKADRAQLDALAALIDRQERLPNAVKAIGIEQLPYRIVKLKL